MLIITANNPVGSLRAILLQTIQLRYCKKYLGGCFGSHLVPLSTLKAYVMLGLTQYCNSHNRSKRLDIISECGKTQKQFLSFDKQEYFNKYAC